MQSVVKKTAAHWSRLGSVAICLSIALLSQAQATVVTLPVPAQADGEVHNPGLWEEYSLYRPAHTEADGQQLPILFFLHGAGRRGTDPSQVQSLPPLAAAANGHEYPFIIAAPQVRPQRSTGESRVLDELEVFMEDVIEMTNADRSRVYIAGQSMGGRGTWDLMMRKPDYFAAGIPIAGASNTVPRAARLIDVPIWAFHGRLDKVVPVERSIELIDAIEAAGGQKAQLTIYEDGKHDVWWRTLNRNSEVYDWMLAQQNHDIPEPSSIASVALLTGLLTYRRSGYRRS